MGHLTPLSLLPCSSYLGESWVGRLRKGQAFRNTRMWEVLLDSPFHMGGRSPGWQSKSLWHSSTGLCPWSPGPGPAVLHLTHLSIAIPASWALPSVSDKQSCPRAAEPPAGSSWPRQAWLKAFWEMVTAAPGAQDQKSLPCDPPRSAALPMA